MTHPAALSGDELLAQCRVTRTRRSGPGGQHRNKVETAVVLQHSATGVSAQAAERRSQAENLRVAVRRLRINLAIDVRQALDEPRVPSLLWQSRCHGGRIRVATSHDDFPAVLAEALDFVIGAGADVADAAKQLGCTTSQLLKLLKSEPRAWALVNAHRRDRGLPSLH